MSLTLEVAILYIMDLLQDYLGIAALTVLRKHSLSRVSRTVLRASKTIAVAIAFTPLTLFAGKSGSSSRTPSSDSSSDAGTFLILFCLPAFILFAFFLANRYRFPLIYKMALFIGYFVSMGTIIAIGQAYNDLGEVGVLLCSLVIPVAYCAIIELLARTSKQPAPVPEHLREGVEAFRRHYRKRKRKAFLMMRFGQDKLSSDILATIPSLEDSGLTILRADARSFAKFLLDNVRIYMHGCDFGIAIFDEVEERTFNPNVAFEIGYMFGLDKPVLILKDRRLRFLPSDLLGLLAWQNRIAPRAPR
jgi:hypothetical protein